MSASRFILRKPLVNDGRNAGQGAFGSVCIERDEITGRLRARKLVRLNDERAVHTYIISRQESMLLLSLDHPNIIQCLGFAPAPGGVYIWLEKGERSLEDVLDKAIQEAGGEPNVWKNPRAWVPKHLPVRAPPVPVEKMERWAAQILGGLYYLNFQRKIYHRDIKPANVVLDAADNVKLIDFNVSVQIGPRDTGILTAGCGTPIYMSPEARLARPYTHKCDTFSTGCLIYQMLTGQYCQVLTGYRSAENALEAFCRDPGRLFYALTEAQEKRRDRFAPSLVPYRDDLGDSFLPALYESFIRPEAERMDSLQACNFVYDFVIERERRRQGAPRASAEDLARAADENTKAILAACKVTRRCAPSKVQAVLENIREFIRGASGLAPGDLPDFTAVISTISSFNDQVGHAISTSSLFIGAEDKTSRYRRPGPRASPTVRALVDIMNDSEKPKLSLAARKFFLEEQRARAPGPAGNLFPDMSPAGSSSVVDGGQEVALSGTDLLIMLHILHHGLNGGNEDDGLNALFFDYLRRKKSSGPFNSDESCVRAETYATLRFLDDMLGFWMQGDFLELVVEIASRARGSVNTSILSDGVEGRFAADIRYEYAELRDVLMHDLRYDPLGIQFLDACIRVVSHYADGPTVGRVLERLWQFYSHHPAHPMLQLAIPEGRVHSLLGRSVFSYAPQLFSFEKDAFSRSASTSVLSAGPASPTSAFPAFPAFPSFDAPSSKLAAMEIADMKPEDQDQVRALSARLGLYLPDDETRLSPEARGAAVPSIWLSSGDLVDMSFMYLTVAFFGRFHSVHPVFDFWLHDRLDITRRQERELEAQVKAATAKLEEGGGLTYDAVLTAICRVPSKEVSAILGGLPPAQAEAITAQMTAQWERLKELNARYVRGALPGAYNPDPIRVLRPLGSWEADQEAREAVAPAWVRDTEDTGFYVITRWYNCVFARLARADANLEYMPPIERRFTLRDMVAKPMMK